MNELQHGPHIRVFKDTEGHLRVSVDDYELFDMLQDYLAEDCDFDVEATYLLPQSKGCDYTIVVLSGITQEQLVGAIQKLSLNEIERIYLLNNEEEKS